MNKSNFYDLDVKFAENCRYTKHIDKFVINEYANYSGGSNTEHVRYSVGS